ncbi:MAG: DUF4350 domain-containing protein [Longimicrobiaceae bacterium]
MRSPIPAALVLALLAATPAFAQQGPDTTWTPNVPRPAYTGNGPRVGIDEAHLNFHTATGNYRPFATLLRADGYRVEASTARFTRESLAAFDVLVVANARGGTGVDALLNPAFTPEECVAVREWVRAGGSLLLIADHAPFGTAAEALAQQFGVDMSKGWTFDTTRGTAEANPTSLRFDRENGLLGDHPILQGRHPGERVSRVVTFTGQSLSIPAGAGVLLRLSPTAQDRQPPTREEALAMAARRRRMIDSLTAVVRARGGDTTAVLATPIREEVSERYAPAAGRAQGLALTVGSGRVVILGEAAMFSAQVVNLPGREPMRMGLNVPGHDDQQFALNVLHWLSRLY